MNIQPLPVQPGSAEQARKVLCDPARCAVQPNLRRLAWAVLKSERGQTVRQSIVTGAAHA